MQQHPFQAHLDRVAALEAADPQRGWTPADGALPSLYLSHGAPPTFEDAGWMTQLHTWARSLPEPRAILIVSAHWESAPLSISSTIAGTELVYDFGGFHPMYHRMRYDTPPAEELAQLVVSVLPDGEEVHEHRSRGLDHGAWVPLKVMYPDADVPVLQLSLPTHDASRLLALGRRLRALREHGVLVIGSGFMTHGLPFLTREMFTGNVVPGWSADFDAWAADALARGDVDELAAFATRAPGMPYSHPTVEHFTPLFVTLGAATDPEAPVTTAIEGYAMGLSKRSFQAA
ncbi:dioxygenase [Modestobacter sp. I12A-02662]|uniref:dioxygenase family protein n=1 Tax=Modestobacter sp. I12A-02662 TaxID=1730496 RepID=UPI0034DFEA28